MLHKSYDFVLLQELSYFLSHLVTASPLPAKWSREWHASGRPRWRKNLLLFFRGHAQGHFSVEGAVWNCLGHWIM